MAVDKLAREEEEAAEESATAMKMAKEKDPYYYLSIDLVKLKLK